MADNQCCYRNCKNEATTNGIVFVRNLNGGNDIPTPVKACDVHKHVRGFFESEAPEGKEAAV